MKSTRIFAEVPNISDDGFNCWSQAQADLTIVGLQYDASYMPVATQLGPQGGWGEVYIQVSVVPAGQLVSPYPGAPVYPNMGAANPDFGPTGIDLGQNAGTETCNAAVMGSGQIMAMILKTWVPPSGEASAVGRGGSITGLALKVNKGDYIVLHADHMGIYDGQSGDFEFQGVLFYEPAAG